MAIENRTTTDVCMVFCVRAICNLTSAATGARLRWWREPRRSTRVRVGRVVRAHRVEVAYQVCFRYRNSAAHQLRMPQRRPPTIQTPPVFRSSVGVRLTWLGKSNRSGDSVKNANIDPPQATTPRTTTKWATPRRRRRSHQRCMPSDQYQENLVAIRAP